MGSIGMLPHISRASFYQSQLLSQTATTATRQQPRPASLRRSPVPEQHRCSRRPRARTRTRTRTRRPRRKVTSLCTSYKLILLSHFLTVKHLSMSKSILPAHVNSCLHLSFFKCAKTKICWLRYLSLIFYRFLNSFLHFLCINYVCKTEWESAISASLN